MTDLFVSRATPPDSQASYSGAFGNRFNVGATTYVNNVYYYRRSTGANPDRVNIWDLSTSTRVWTSTAVNPGGLSGAWVDVVVSPQLTLVTGRDYLVEVAGSGSFVFSGWATSPPAISAGYTLVGARYGSGSPAGLVSGWELIAIGVGSANTTGGGADSTGSTGTGTPVFTGDLPAWLSTDGAQNLHQADGLPWTTKSQVDLTKIAADAIKVVTDKLGHGGSGNSLDWIVGLWRLAGDLTDAEIGLLKALLDHKDQLVGASGGGGSAFYGPSGTQVAEGVETLLASGITPTELGAQLAVLRERLTLSPDLTDTARWTLVDTASGSGDALVELQADLYRLSVTAPVGPPSGPLVAGVAWHPRAFWLAPRAHGGFLQRQPLADFGVNTIAPGLFMDGLLLAIDPGYTWSVEAYVLDR